MGDRVTEARSKRNAREHTTRAKNKSQQQKLDNVKKAQKATDTKKRTAYRAEIPLVPPTQCRCSQCVALVCASCPRVTRGAGGGGDDAGAWDEST